MRPVGVAGWDKEHSGMYLTQLESQGIVKIFQTPTVSKHSKRNIVVTCNRSFIHFVGQAKMESGRIHDQSTTMHVCYHSLG